MTTSGAGGPVRVRTTFLGSGAFAVPALRWLATSPDVRLVGIVTAPQRPVGRRQVPTPTPIGALAEELDLGPVLTPTRLRAPEAISGILALEPGLAVLADYGQIVPRPLLDLRFHALNLHPSLLPRWRGASPIPATIAAGDGETGVSLLVMDAGLDTGPIVAQARLPLHGDERAPELEARLASIAAELLAANLEPWLAGRLEARDQLEHGGTPTLTRPLTRDDGRLDVSQPAAVLERLVRAYLPWPGTYLDLDGERLVVTEARVAGARPGDVPGTLVREGPLPALATADGRLVLLRVTPAGRRPMPGADWVRGRRVPSS